MGICSVKQRRIAMKLAMTGMLVLVQVHERILRQWEMVKTKAHVT